MLFLYLLCFCISLLLIYFYLFVYFICRSLDFSVLCSSPACYFANAAEIAINCSFISPAHTDTHAHSHKHTPMRDGDCDANCDCGVDRAAHVVCPLIKRAIFCLFRFLLIIFSCASLFCFYSALLLLLTIVISPRRCQRRLRCLSRLLFGFFYFPSAV